jgi:5-deoxy-glucuronate isomerase
VIADPQQLLVHSSTPDDDGVCLGITVESAGWEYCGLIVRYMEAGQNVEMNTGRDEIAIVLLGGDCTVAAAGAEYRLDSRPGIFAGPPCAVYLPIDTPFRLSANAPTQIALCAARAERSFPVRHIPADEVSIEIRGAGNAARQINHIIKPDFPADRILVVEVFTPSGNWSSFPPHKHDVSRMPEEADLEEIYYYRIEPDDGFAFQRLYTADGSVDQPYIIRDGDALIMPEGYHAYAVAHGYTGYYLNILAGDEPVRTMQPFDDPTYGWIRATWSDAMNYGLSRWQDIDERINGEAGRPPARKS